jgi:hypothetical protein
MAALERGPYVQYGAAEALGKLGDPRAVPALISVVARGDYANAVAAIALGLLGDPSAIAPIAEALAGSGSADRARMAKALAALDARDALLRIAADDTSGMLSRWPAAMELARLGDARVVDVLISMPMDVEEFEIEALDVLGRLADNRGLPFVLQRAGSVTQVVTVGLSGPYSAHGVRATIYDSPLSRRLARLPILEVCSGCWTHWVPSTLRCGGPQPPLLPQSPPRIHGFSQPSRTAWLLAALVLATRWVS